MAKKQGNTIKITARTLAQLAGCSERTVRRWRKGKAGKAWTKALDAIKKELNQTAAI